MFRAACTWALRCDLECEVCAQERRRRCRVMLPGTGLEDAHMREPFAHAPFVHPFNVPKYHAQQLRAVNYGKATGARGQSARSLKIGSR